MVRCTTLTIQNNKKIKLLINKLKKYLSDSDEREEFIDSYFKGGD